jgi:hypothetical protein
MNAKLVSTIIGLGLIIVSILGFYGVLTSDEVKNFSAWWPQIVELVMGLILALSDPKKLELRNLY